MENETNEIRRSFELMTKDFIQQQLTVRWREVKEYTIEKKKERRTVDFITADTVSSLSNHIPNNAISHILYRLICLPISIRSYKIHTYIH